MSDSFVIFAFIAVIIFLVINIPSNEEESKEPQEKDEFLEKSSIPISSNIPASPVIPPVTEVQAPSVEQSAPTAQNVEFEKKPEKLPESIRGYVASYRYTEVGIFVPKDKTFDVEGFEPDAILTLVQDPENPHDNRAVGLKLRKRLVGYLYRGKLQDMANDWIEKKKPLRAQLTACMRDKQRAEVTLVFYDLSQYKKYLAKYPNAKEYRLTGNTNEEMQENIDMCSRGDECSIDYDIEKEKYLVSSGLDIGYLPAGAAKHIDADGEDAYDIYVSDIDFNDRGKNVISVYLFPKAN